MILRLNQTPHGYHAIIIIIIKPYLSAHTQLSPYAQQIQTTIYNEKQYETNKPN